MSERLRIAFEEAVERAIYLPVQVSGTGIWGYSHPDMAVAVSPIIWQALVEAIEAELKEDESKHDDS